MVNLWFTEKDLRYRWSEVKDNFWDDFEILTKDVARQMLERGLQIERESMIGASHYERSFGPICKSISVSANFYIRYDLLLIGQYRRPILLHNLILINILNIT